MRMFVEQLDQVRIDHRKFKMIMIQSSRYQNVSLRLTIAGNNGKLLVVAKSQEKRLECKSFMASFHMADEHPLNHERNRP